MCDLEPFSEIQSHITLITSIIITIMISTYDYHTMDIIMLHYNMYVCLLFTIGITQVNVTMLQCDPVNLINQCTVTWNWNSLQEAITSFQVISSVNTYNVSSQTRSYTFPVLSLPDGASSGEVTVIVIAVNELDQGPPSEVARANVTGKLQRLLR